jgi:methyl-accepting chemotaxis protein
MTRRMRVTIGFRLMASVALAACLLGGMAGGIHLLVNGAAGSVDSALDAARKQGWINDARYELARVSALGREVQLAQRASEIDAATGAAATQMARVRDLVGHAARDPNADVAAAGAAALAASETFAAKLAEVAGQRKRLLVARDDRMFPTARNFDFALETVNSGIDLLSLPQGQDQEVRQRLQTVANAAYDLRVGVVQYLATRDAGQRQRVMRGIATANANLRGVLGNAELPAAFKTELGQLSTTLSELSDAARQILALHEAGLKLVAEDFSVADTAATTAMARANELLSARAAADGVDAAAGLAETIRTMLFAAGVIVLVQLLAGWWNARAIARPLRGMVGAVARIAKGDTARPVHGGERRDELGEMARGLEELRKVSVEAFAQSQMLQQMHYAVVTADPRDEFRIDFVNPATVRGFAAIRHPSGVQADALVGASIDLFDTTPGQLRALLADGANLPHATRISIGGQTIELNVTAITDRTGAYVKPMLCWSNVTHQVELANKFETDVGAVVASVSSAADSMRGVAEAMERSAAETGARAGSVSAASDQAAANVQTVAASAEELAASVQEIARQVSESATIAAQAESEARATDAQMAHLSEAAQKIGDVVRLIGDIAGQTNLLALNATIEAARAGEAGKGFAVVAGEVKSLAGQTAKATEEIAAQIGAMQGATGQAVGAIRSIGGTITRLNEIAAGIAAAVEQQGKATAEIARSVQQASAGTSEVNANMGAVSSAVEQAGQQAAQVLNSARQLSGESARLKGEVEGFLTALRAA